jgi:outer membrane immunogenic protein
MNTNNRILWVSFAFLTVGSANAADLGVRAPAPPPLAMVAPPPMTWTGCYIGGSIGGGWGRKDITIPNLATAAEIPASEVNFSVPAVRANTSGFLGGGQVGCNYQFAPNWMIGVEGDGSAADIKGDASPPPVAFPIPGGGVAQITSTFHARTQWLASATGRLGWAAGSWLIYAKGGVAWAGDKYAADIPIFQEHLDARQTRTGWTVGGGVEWAFWNNWSAKLEYDFSDLGTRTVTLTGTFPGVGPSTFPAGSIAVPGVRIKQTISQVKFGINYRFGPISAGPVVASY